MGLKVLVPLIREDPKQAEDAGMPYYRAAGEKLIEAKLNFTDREIAIGEFKWWAKEEVGLRKDQARHYMRDAEAMEVTPAGATQRHASLKDFLRSENPNAETGKPAWHAPVKQIIGRVDTETKPKEDRCWARRTSW